jgi:hypothetical protein
MATSTTHPVDLQDLAEVGTGLIDLTGESLATLRSSGTSVLSHAIRRAISDAEIGTEISAGFNNKL